MKHALLLCSAGLLLSGHLLQAGPEPRFPFVLPWDDATPGVTDMSGLLEKPAGSHGFIQARDGHLFADGKRIRFFGVNTVFGANFPTHEAAEKIAARMAKFGINCVRFHHMDNRAAPSGIWNEDMRTLNAGQLDKLDYFIAQLKAHGIYSDLNLHVSRVYPGMPEWKEAPGFSKGVDLFYPPMLEMQRDYARQLLRHVNPYTHTAYADEPAVALVEINNENGLIEEWNHGALDP
ncbi:MAG: cellulase family glycosylhydrolase, partial [Chthoniobacteraceae bacterium]|nr:cellulase family glycosylhydrolase [Chthoniobacteraceae bacterium]